MRNHENHASKPGSFGLLTSVVLAVAVCCVAILLMPAQPAFEASGNGAAPSAESAATTASQRDGSIGPGESTRCRDCAARPQNALPRLDERGSHEILRFATLATRIVLAGFLAWGGALCLLCRAGMALRDPGSGTDAARR